MSKELGTQNREDSETAMLAGHRWCDWASTLGYKKTVVLRRNIFPRILVLIHSWFRLLFQKLLVLLSALSSKLLQLLCFDNNTKQLHVKKITLLEDFKVASVRQHSIHLVLVDPGPLRNSIPHAIPACGRHYTPPVHNGRTIGKI